MKYIKLFEEQTDEPELGDYVICEECEEGKGSQSPVLVNFLKNNIGKITQHFPGIGFPYTVFFENANFISAPEVMDHFSSQTRNYRLSEIKHFSKYEEDLEHIIQGNKYNL